MFEAHLYYDNPRLRATGLLFFSSLIRQWNNGRRRRLIDSGSFYDCAHTGHGIALDAVE
jgi:hypothetical protein